MNEQSAEERPTSPPTPSTEAPSSGPEDYVVDLEKELTLLWRRSRSIARQVAQHVHPDMDASAYGLLVIVSRERTIRLTDLAAHLGVGKPSLSRQVGFLESIGMLEKLPDPNDGRAQIITLTTKGIRRVASVQHARTQVFRERVRDWPASEVADLARLLGKLNDSYSPESYEPEQFSPE